jgi:hypothetical protein
MSAAAPAKPTGSAGYSLAKVQGKCQTCGREIPPGQKLMAALRETPAALERLDVCPACWPNFDKQNLIGFWQMTMPEPSTKKPIFVDDELLCELFERLAEATEPAKVNFRFMLGLILMRKRRIAYESTRVQDGADIWSVRFRGREDKMDLVDPKLDKQQMAELSTQLSEILSADL